MPYNQNDPFGLFIRPLSSKDIKVYSEYDVVHFRPSYEYIISHEKKSCQHCRSLIYNHSNDIKNLSLFEIINFYYNPTLRDDDTTIEKIEKTLNKIDDFFGILGMSSYSRFKKRNIKSSCERLKDKLKINEKLLMFPILHRCNKCFMAWNIHFEMKQRFQCGTSLFPFFDSFTFDLPKTEKFYQGLIFLKENSESIKITNHILGIKKMLIDNKDHLLLLAKKEISIGNINGALEKLTAFIDQNENAFFQNYVLQIQARFSAFSQKKIQGTLSYQDEVLQWNKISSDIISLIGEINRYKNM